jgi:fluoroacetyl-CoA thioesterase
VAIVHTITEADLAAFITGMVHPFYATFALGRDAEWASRQFVLQMKEEDEEGIGTYLTVEHKSPALLGETVSIEAEITGLDGNSVHCRYVATVGDRIIAEGTTGQKILKKEKVERIINSIHGR